MKWIETAGGPFVLMSLDDVQFWAGYSGDYEVACEVEEVTGIIGFGNLARERTAIVLGDEPLKTGYLPEYQSFVQWMYAESEDDLIRMVISQIPRAEWSYGPAFEVCNGAVLFDAAIPGAELESDDSLEVRLSDGVYRVRTFDALPGGRQAARIHQLVMENTWDG